MKRPKRILHIIGILFILIFMACIFIQRAIHEQNPLWVLVLLLMIINVLATFYRLYQYYLLEKIRNNQYNKDFVDYFDTLSPFRFFVLTMIPFPIIKKSNNNTENKLRKVIVITLFVSWVTFILLILLLPGREAH